MYLFLIISHLFGMDNGRLSIIPEYDYNGVTILFSGQRDSIDIGRLQSMTVPANTDSVFLIITDDDKNIYFEQYDIISRNGYDWIDFPSETGRYSFMMKTGPFIGPESRNFNYDLIFSFFVKNLLLEIQQPLGSQNFLHSESEATVDSDQHGLRSYTIELSNIPLNKPRNIWIRYDNPDAFTSLTLLSKMMSDTNEDERKGQPAKNIIRYKLYVWEPLLAIAVVTIIIAAILILLKDQKKTNACPKCTQLIFRGQKFCPNCGNKV